MARYDYRCPSCGLQFEVEHPMAERPEITCPDCGAPAQQVFGASSIVFKGSGFYNTDQRGASGATKATSAPTEAKSDAKPAKKDSKDTTKASSSTSE